MEIVEYLVNELGVSATQAQGGAGLILELAQQRLTAEEFVELANTIPAVSDVIGKAPRAMGRPVGPVREMLSRWFGGLGGLSGLAARFDQLGCDNAMARRFADRMVVFFRERGGAEVAALLQNALR